MTLHTRLGASSFEMTEVESPGRPTPEVEIVDSSIVGLLSEPPARLSELAQLVEVQPLSQVLRKPVTVNQTFSLVAGSLSSVPNTPSASFQIESMRSQKVAIVDGAHIEVHDRSGSLAPATPLPNVFSALAGALGIEQLTQLGINTVLTFGAPSEESAAASIRRQLISQQIGSLLGDLKLSGAGARLFMRGPQDTAYTLVLEPRGNDPDTDVVWALCSAQVEATAVPSLETLGELIAGNQGILRNVVEALFPGVQGWE